MLAVSELCFNYNGRPILKEVTVQVPTGKLTAVAGPNGAGKTTLLKCVARILKPTGGRVTVGGHDAAGLSRKALSRRIGYVPQQMPLRFPMTVFEAVLAGRRPYMAWRPTEKDVVQTARIIREMRLDDLAMRGMEQLSGGQAQKVMIARALAQEAEYLLLDEPTSSLDLFHQLEVLDLVTGLVKRKGMGALIAMHDLNLAARFADTVLMMQGGGIVRRGTPAEVITAETISKVYGVEAAVRHDNGYPNIQPLRCMKSSQQYENSHVSGGDIN